MNYCIYWTFVIGNNTVNNKQIITNTETHSRLQASNIQRLFIHQHSCKMWIGEVDAQSNGAFMLIFLFIRSSDHLWREESLYRIWEVLQDVWIQWGKKKQGEKFEEIWCDTDENIMICDTFQDKEQETETLNFHQKVHLCCVLQLDLTFHLFVCALAGAGAAVIAMVRTIILTSDWLRPGVLIGTDWNDLQPVGQLYNRKKKIRKICCSP